MKKRAYTRGTYYKENRFDKSIFFDCPQEIVNKVKELAEIKGLSKSEMLRQLIISEHLKQFNQVPITPVGE